MLEDFSDENNDAVLFVGSDDLVRLSAALGRDWPAEVQTMQWWFWAVRRDETGLSQLESLSDALHGLFPDIHQRPRWEQKALGREAIAWVRSELSLADPMSKR